MTPPARRPPPPAGSGAGSRPRRAGAATAVLLLLLAGAGTLHVGRRVGAWGGAWPPPREAPAPAEVPPPDASAPAAPDAAFAATASPPPAVDPWRRAFEDPTWRRYPVETVGPVVVGVLVLEGDEDPPAWVALESLDDPGRTDPSVVTSLGFGRFRMHGFPAGRYRVRALGDDCVATYSEPFDARDGAVADAGVLRLRPHGEITGVVLDAAGLPVDAEVRVVGRDPASLAPARTATTRAHGARGFSLPGRATETVTLSVLGATGWAETPFHPDADGGGHVAVRLLPWATVTVGMAPPPRPDAPAARVLGAAATPADPTAPGASLAAPLARGERFPLSPGRWTVDVRWTAGAPGTPPEGIPWRTEVVVAAGDEVVITVPW